MEFLPHVSYTCSIRSRSRLWLLLAANIETYWQNKGCLKTLRRKNASRLQQLRQERLCALHVDLVHYAQAQMMFCVNNFQSWANCSELLINLTMTLMTCIIYY